MADMADIPPYPLYNKTYHLYRLSPLHHGHARLLDPPVLRLHARRLKEQLKGDSVRGVQVDFAAPDDDTARLGPLDDCTWALLGDEDAWIDRHRDHASSPTLPLPHHQARGIDITLEYEKQSYTALLLRDPAASAASPTGFTALPLLLVKMPGPVRHVFLNYLRTAFDAHVAPMRLSSAFITASLESYFNRLSASTSTQSIQDVVRQLHVQLAFPTTTSLLKHLDITIAGPHVPGFVSRGKQLRNASHRPFTAALAHYLQTHLALDMAHPKTHVSRISCNSFHLGTDRLKLAAPDPLPDTSSSDLGGASQDTSAGQLAVHDFYTSLVREAAGSGKFLPAELAQADRDTTPSSTTSAGAGRRKRAISNAATGNTNSKKPKARGKENGKKSNGHVMADA